MNKEEFVKSVSSKLGGSNGQAEAAVDAVIESIVDALKQGDEVMFVGFGKFTVVRRTARSGINPRTGEKMQIAPSNGAKFTAGSKLKTALNS